MVSKWTEEDVKFLIRKIPSQVIGYLDDQERCGFVIDLLGWAV